MKKNHYIFLAILNLIIVSCDPPHSINIINESNSDLKVKFKLDTSLNYNEYSRFENSNSDYLISYIKPKDTLNLFFGIGTWSDKEIRRNINCLKSLEYENEELKTIYKTKNKIFELYQTNREKGLCWKTLINIKIK